MRNEPCLIHYFRRASHPGRAQFTHRDSAIRGLQRAEELVAAAIARNAAVDSEEHEHGTVIRYGFGIDAYRSPLHTGNTGTATGQILSGHFLPLQHHQGDAGKKQQKKPEPENGFHDATFCSELFLAAPDFDFPTTDGTLNNNVAVLARCDP